MRSKPHQNQPPSPAPENPARPETPMGNFRAFAMTMAMNSAPNGSLSPSQRVFVHQKLLELFPDSKPTPDHPPYSWMIQRAIENLNEEGGSTEEAISEYIVKENSSLPWAHTTLLSHHLGKLCESNEIFQTVDGYYALNDPTTNTCPAASPNECISSDHSSDKKRVNPKNVQKKDSEKRKGKLGECNVSGEKVQMDVEKEATEEEDLLDEKDEKIDVIEEQHPPHGKMYKNDQQGQEEPANLKLDIHLQVLDGNAHVEPKEQASKQMQQDFVSEKCRGEHLNKEQELEKGTRRSSRVAKRNRKNYGLEEQTNKEIHVLTQRLEGLDPEEPNEQIQQDLASEEYNKDEEQQLNTEQALEKMKRKQGKPHKNVGLINSESDFQCQELDAAQNENKQMQQGFTNKECKEAEEQPLNREHEQMILKAIENLNEEGGSTVVTISEYILRENSNSPWAYTVLLSRHLGELCQRNEIFETVEDYYALNRPPITKIRPTSSPDECISSKHGSDRKRVNPKTIQKKDSKRRKEGKFGKCNVRGEKVQTNTDDEATEEEDLVSRECYEDEERQLNSRRPGKVLKRKRRKMVLEDEEEEEIDVQGQQKGRRLPKRRIKKVVQEEENNLEMDGQLLRFEDGARKEPNKKMRQDVVSEKRKGEQLNRVQELQKGKRRSSRVPKRNRKNNDLEKQTNIEIHGLKDTDPEEPNEQAQQVVEIEECNKDVEQHQNTEQALKKGKRKQGKTHKNVVEEPTNSESDFQPQDLDDSQNENECREAEEQQLKRKGKLGSRQKQLQTCRPKTKSIEGLLTKPSAHLLQSSSQNRLQLGDRKHIKQEESAKTPEIRRSTRISIATSKKKEYNSAT
nr:HMG-Y-related protein A-like [Ipomoea batatas]